MRKFILLFFGLLFVVGVILTLLLLINDIKSPRPAVVHLKPGVAQDSDRDGTITTTDKYVSVSTSKHGSEIFTWDQILFISEKDLSGSRHFDRVVDLIDLLSKFGLVATVVFFFVGLYQYQRSQKWEREKFLAAIVKEFDESKTVRNARQMIDSLAQYPKGRKIDLLEADKPEDRKVMVLNSEIYDALTTDANKLHNLDDRAVAIRDCFDDFLSSLVTFEHYIEQSLITKDALMAHVGYWILILGRDPDQLLALKYKRRIFEYAEFYGLLDVESLVRKYYRGFDWKKDFAKREVSPGKKDHLSKHE